MKLYSENNNYKLYEGSMLDMLDVIEANSVDSIVCDPPYELNFMNKGWDNSGIAFKKETWQKCFEVLKSGGYLLAFGGSRTFHRIACAIEDAGFEIRDTIMWLYGSGFPKSLNIGLAIDKKNGVESKVIGTMDAPDLQDVGQKQKELGNGHIQSFGQIENAERLQYEIKQAQNEWAGWGTSLKPAYEPIIVARKPCENSATENVLKYGVGGINIDECRIPFEDTQNAATNPLYRKNAGYKLPEKGQISNSTIRFSSSKNDTNDLGRFPANVILTYDDNDFEEVCGEMPNETGGGKLVRNYEINRVGLTTDNSVFNSQNCGFKTNIKNDSISCYGDSGSASRYFYCAKASKKDRDDGLCEFEEKQKLEYCLQYNNGEKRNENAFRRNIHPTVKPVDLMQYLVRLVSPKGATILDPFMGSGSTGKAVMFENREREKEYKFIGIELTEEYLPIAKARIDYAIYTFEYELEQEKKRRNQISIFDL